MQYERWSLSFSTRKRKPLDIFLAQLCLTGFLVARCDLLTCNSHAEVTGRRVLLNSNLWRLYQLTLYPNVARKLFTLHFKSDLQLSNILKIAQRFRNRLNLIGLNFTHLSAAAAVARCSYFCPLVICFWHNNENSYSCALLEQPVLKSPKTWRCIEQTKLTAKAYCLLQKK